MQAPRVTFGVFLAAIIVIAALVVPSVASAHVGHHGPQAAVADAARQGPGMTAIESADAHEAAAPVVLASRADGGPPAGRPCPAPCCCPSDGMGCASPALGAAPAAPSGPTVAWAENEIAPASHLPDALRERLRKPPKA